MTSSPVPGRDGTREGALAVLRLLSDIAPVTNVVRGNVDIFAGGLFGQRGYTSLAQPEALACFPVATLVALSSDAGRLRIAEGGGKAKWQVRDKFIFNFARPLVD